MKYCPECGCENLLEAQFCRNCGFKFNAEVEKTESNVKVDTYRSDSGGVNSVIEKLFYKNDKYTDELRIAKAKSISIGVFIVMFFFCIFVNLEGSIFAVLIFASIIFGLIFAIPTYVIGYAIGILLDRFSH